MKRYFKDKHIRLYLCLIASLYFLYSGITREKILLHSDLITVKGNYITHSFKDETGYRRNGHEYYIWIKQSTNPFQIKADYLDIFNDAAFISTVRVDDKIEFTIPKRLENKLGSNENIFVTSIEVNGTKYLSQNETISREKRINDSNTEYLLAGMFLIPGLLAYFVRLPRLS